VQREVAERWTAARAYEDTGQARHAERLRAEADLLGSYLRDSASDGPSEGEPYFSV
jgi:uncharacterized protein YqeY